MPGRRISATFTQSIPGLCTRRGYNPAKLFHAAGLNSDSMAVADASMTVDEYCALLRICGHTLDDPHIGITVGSTLTPQMLGAFGLRLHYSRTIGEGISFIEHYSRYIQQALDVKLQQTGRTYILRIAVLDGDIPNISHLIETMLALCVSWIRRSYRPGWEPVKIYLTGQSASNGHGVSGFFRCPVVSNSEFNGIEYTADTHHASLPHSDPALCQVLEDYLERQGGLSCQSKDLRTMVMDAISEKLPTSELQIGVISKDLGLSPRTLQRRLDGQNLSFSSLVTEVRHDTARKLLRLGTHTVCEVAFLTGYSDASAFSRAFQKREGVPPSRFR